MPEHAARSLRRGDGTRLRLVHLTTVDMSLALLLRTELTEDLAAGLDTVGMSAPGRYVPQIEALGVPHVPIPSLTRSWDPASDRSAVRELVAALREVRPDILHTHNPKTGVLGRVLGRLLRIPVVVNTCHGLWAAPDDPWRRRFPVYAAELAATVFSHAELFQNATDLNTLRPLLPARRARVVGNGTDLARFRPSAAERHRVRAELDVPEDRLLVGGVGRVVAEKGIVEFAAAAEELAGLATFVWVGPDDPGKADALSARDFPAVRFLGERPDMAAVYNALDVFVLPSYREGFSRSAMEAAACGTAMVLSDIRGCREIGEDGTHLLLVPPRDPAALAGQVRRLVADAGLRGDLGAAARARALEEFDQREVARRSLATYAEVAGRRGLGWRWGCADATHR